MSEKAETQQADPVDHEPTPESRELVRELAKSKPSQERIAKELGITHREFRRHYIEDWEDGREEARSALNAKLLAQGMAGNTNAAMKYMISMGMLLPAPKRVEVTGKNGGPVETIDLSRLTLEQLEQYGRLAAIAEGVDPDSILVEPIGPRA